MKEQEIILAAHWRLGIDGRAVDELHQIDEDAVRVGIDLLYHIPYLQSNIWLDFLWGFYVMNQSQSYISLLVREKIMEGLSWMKESLIILFLFFNEVCF